MDVNRHAFYENELAYPGQSDRMEVSGDIDGWYRIGTKAQKKHMYPVVIFHDGVNADAWVQVGQALPFLLNSERGLEFQSSTWLSCEAVEDKQYQQAISDGVWWDGRAARKPPTPKPTQEESGPAPDPAEPLSNSDNADDFEFWEDELEALIDAAKSLPTTLTSKAEALKADSIYQRLRQLWKRVDNRRAEEKAPHDRAAAAVQTKYKGTLLDPAQYAAVMVKDVLDDYLRAEEHKLREEEARLRRIEQEARAKLNMPEPVRERPQPTAKVASGFGTKATSLRTTYVGVIENETKFINAIKGGKDFQDWLQTKANALARAKVETKGMRIETQR